MITYHRATEFMDMPASLLAPVPDHEAAGRSLQIA